MLQTYYDHWSQVPMELWCWPDFSPQELACRGTGKLKLDFASLDKLQALRNAIGKPLIVNSAYRSPEHNKAVGGVPDSKHLDAQAYDVSMANHDPIIFEARARACGFTGFGHYVSKNFMHIDTGPTRKWHGSDGKYFPTTPTPTPTFQPEKPKETIVDVLKKPEVWGPAGAAAGSAGTLAQGSGPVQIAIAVCLVLVVGFVIWRATQKSGHEQEPAK